MRAAALRGDDTAAARSWAANLYGDNPNTAYGNLGEDEKNSFALAGYAKHQALKAKKKRSGDASQRAQDRKFAKAKEQSDLASKARAQENQRY
jgi:hypothetical protein